MKVSVSPPSGLLLHARFLLKNEEILRDKRSLFWNFLSFLPEMPIKPKMLRCYSKEVSKNPMISKHSKTSVM
jgi:hypothetical protein